MALVARWQAVRSRSLGGSHSWRCCHSRCAGAARTLLHSAPGPQPEVTASTASWVRGVRSSNYTPPSTCSLPPSLSPLTCSPCPGRLLIRAGQGQGGTPVSAGSPRRAGGRRGGAAAAVGAGGEHRARRRLGPAARGAGGGGAASAARRVGQRTGAGGPAAAARCAAALYLRDAAPLRPAVQGGAQHAARRGPPHCTDGQSWGLPLYMPSFAATGGGMHLPAPTARHPGSRQCQAGAWPN